MKQSHLIRLVSNDTGVKYGDVRRILRKVTKYVAVALEQGDDCRMGVGTFTVKQRKAKEVTNFQTRQRYMLPATHLIKFVPSNYLKGTLKKLNLSEAWKLEEEQQQKRAKVEAE